jgi:hypothetical protein
LRQRNTSDADSGRGDLERQRAFRTLNDTELRQNFRRKNTRRKSFLGHAQA